MKKLTVTLSIKEAFGVASLYDEVKARLPDLRKASSILQGEGMEPDEVRLGMQLDLAIQRFAQALIQIDSADD